LLYSCLVLRGLIYVAQILRPDKEKSGSSALLFVQYRPSELGGMTGYHKLRTPEDLLDKLSRELSRLKREPHEVDHAFNFFVTADSLLDQVLPGKKHKKERKRDRQNNDLLAFCHQVATGARHFESSRSVKSAASKRTVRRTALLINGHATYLLVGDDDGKKLGETVTTLDLARQVLDYWKKRLR
jgi:hypothetical protein